MISDDVKDMREQFFINLDQFTNQQLAAAFDGKDYVVWTARERGWDDTEARESAGDVLERELNISCR